MSGATDPINPLSPFFYTFQTNFGPNENPKSMEILLISLFFPLRGIWRAPKRLVVGAGAVDEESQAVGAASEEAQAAASS